MLHGRFSRFPAQINGLAGANSREIDEAQIDIFDDAAQRFDSVDQTVDLQFQVAEGRRRKRRSNAGEPLRVRLLYVVQRGIRFQQFDR